MSSNLTAIPITPMSYGVEQRREAVIAARRFGQGVRMTLGNVTTRFHADPDVAVGKIAIYMAKEYKGWPEYTETLDSPDSEWAWEIERAEQMAALFGTTSADAGTEKP